MKSLVVFFAIVAMAVAAPYVAPFTYTMPTAVSHQSRIDVHDSPAVVATVPYDYAPVGVAPILADPVIDARYYANPVNAFYNGIVPTYYNW